MPDLQVYHKKLCLIKFDLDVHVFVSLSFLFSFAFSLHFLHIKSSGEIMRIKHLSIQRNIGIFYYISNQIKVSGGTIVLL